MLLVGRDSFGSGWIFGQFAVAYTSSFFMLGLAQVFNPDYVPKNWHYYLIYVAIALVVI